MKYNILQLQEMLLQELKDVAEQLRIPDYKKLSLVLKDSKKLFVLANYQFNLFAYAIRLDSDSSIENVTEARPMFFLLYSGLFRSFSPSSGPVDLLGWIYLKLHNKMWAVDERQDKRW